MKTQTETQKDWLDKCQNLLKAARALEISWQDLTEKDSASLSENYPFYNDYESVASAIGEWFWQMHGKWGK